MRTVIKAIVLAAMFTTTAVKAVTCEEFINAYDNYRANATPLNKGALGRVNMLTALDGFVKAEASHSKEEVERMMRKSKKDDPNFRLVNIAYRCKERPYRMASDFYYDYMMDFYK